MADVVSLSHISFVITKKNRYRISLVFLHCQHAETTTHTSIAVRVLQLLQMSVGIELPITTVTKSIARKVAQSSKKPQLHSRVHAKEYGLEIRLVPGLECTWSPQETIASNAEIVRKLEPTLEAASARLDQAQCTDNPTSLLDMDIQVNLVDSPAILVNNPNSALDSDLLNKDAPTNILNKDNPTSLFETEDECRIASESQRAPEAQSLDSTDSVRHPPRAIFTVKRRAGKPYRKPLERACPGSIERCFK